jgi:predicted TPR repeat methyltransferase
LAEAHNNLGIVLHELARPDEAEASYRKALQIRPDYSDAHANLAHTLSSLGRTNEALACYQRQIELDPEAVSAQHHIAALTGKNTERAPDRYIENLFDSYADKFDTHLQQELEYEAPAKLAALVERRLAPVAEKWNILDLGCGTGLVGSAMAPFAQRLVGVDLSEKMLKKANARNIYQRLERSDLLVMMRSEEASSYDVIVAADVFIYLGKIDEIVGEIKRLLRPGGVFAFSIETLDPPSNEEASRSSEQEYRLKETGRYSQSISYLARLASANDFLSQEMVAVQIRMEKGKPVKGHLVLWESLDKE